MTLKRKNASKDLNKTPDACKFARAEFSAYLDGAMSGVEMAAIAAHLHGCHSCSTEFAAWRTVQQSLADLGPAQPPERLQASLRGAIAVEYKRGAHLSFGRRALQAWRSSVAPMALRVSGGVAAAVILLGSAGWFFGAPIAVQANDDYLAHLVGPRYLYSQVPPQPIETGHGVPIIVEVQVDTEGRVYDYSVLEGPKDPKLELQVEDDLLSSVFKPATVFGVPVRGHVVMTYTGVSVKG